MEEEKEGWWNYGDEKWVVSIYKCGRPYQREE